MTSRPPVNAAPGPWPVVLVHGSLLAAVLLWFRLAKADFSGLTFSPTDWLALVLPDLGFVLLFEAAWLLLSRLPSKRWWMVLLIAAHAVVYLLTVVSHGFFVETGYRPHFDLVSYAVSHFGTVREILAASADGAFWGHVALVVVALAAGHGLPRWRFLRERRRPGWVVTLGLALLGGWLLFASPAPDGEIKSLARNDVEAFADSIVTSFGTEVSVAPHMISPDDLYREPVIEGAVERRPNIVLVILESTGARAVGADFARHSPEIAAIAKDSVIVDNAYSTVTHTSKALIGLLCGMMPRLDMPIVEALEGNLPIPCLPKMLAGLGYETAFMQTALGRFENRPGLVANLGFQRGAYQETVERPGFEKTGYLGMDEFAMLDPAVGWAATRGDQPFFLTLLTVSPHHPYETPGVEPTGESEQDYLATLAHQDRFVGELVRRLEATGVLEDGLLVILGDHGEALGEHRVLEHDAVPYQEVVWTPWLLKGPRWVGEPRRIGGLRSHLDFLPTLLEVLGVDWEGHLPGASLLSSAGHDQLFVSCWYRNYCLGLQRDGHKVVYHFGHQATEVFDLTEDPGERHDLAPSLTPERVEGLEAELLAYKLSVDAFWARYPLYDGPHDWWQQDPRVSGKPPE